MRNVLICALCALPTIATAGEIEMPPDPVTPAAAKQAKPKPAHTKSRAKAVAADPAPASPASDDDAPPGTPAPAPAATDAATDTTTDATTDVAPAATPPAESLTTTVAKPVHHGKWIEPYGAIAGGMRLESHHENAMSTSGTQNPTEQWAASMQSLSTRQLVGQVRAV